MAAIVALGACAALAAASRGQAPQFQSGVEAVDVYASVTDDRGTPITGLSRARFVVREDGTPQAITTFAEAEFPLSVAVAVDRSWSMAGRPLARAKAGAGALVDALQSEDQAMAIAVSGRVEPVAPLSTDRGAIRTAIDALDPWSTTALHDAIIQAVDLVQAGTGRRALVLLSDGADRYSQASASEVVAHVRAADVLIYPVALARREPPLFAELASLTGGRSFLATDDKGVVAAMRAIADDLHHQYLLGYAPPARADTQPGTWRSISVSVDVKGAKVRARRGYVVQ